MAAVVLHSEGFFSFLAERLNLLHSRKIVLRVTVQSGKHLLVNLEQRRNLCGEQARQKKYERHGDEGVQCEQRIDTENHDCHSRHYNDVCRHIGERMGDEHLKLACVVYHARHNFSRLLVGVIPHREGLELVVAQGSEISDKIPCRDMSLPH